MRARTESALSAARPRGRLWPQILADVLGVPVEMPPVLEATSLGAALCAFVGAGVFASLGKP